MVINILENDFTNRGRRKSSIHLPERRESSIQLPESAMRRRKSSIIIDQLIAIKKKVESRRGSRFDVENPWKMIEALLKDKTASNCHCEYFTFLSDRNILNILCNKKNILK